MSSVCITQMGVHAAPGLHDIECFRRLASCSAGFDSSARRIARPFEWTLVRVAPPHASRDSRNMKTDFTFPHTRLNPFDTREKDV
jgi:hypothetical protein